MKLTIEDGLSICVGDHDDIVIGICRPIGTDTSAILERIEERLRIARYNIYRIRLSDLIYNVSEYTPFRGVFRKNKRINESISLDERLGYMRCGDFLRATVSTDIVARLAIRTIAHKRYQIHCATQKQGLTGTCYIIRNIMHHAEVSILRSVYGHRFFLIAANESLESRKKRLSAEMAKLPSFDSDEVSAAVAMLMSVDKGARPSAESYSRGALSIDKTFHQADLFVRVDAPKWEEQIDRFLNQIFGDPFGTLTADERGMGIATLVSSSSGAFGRRVGAAIVTKSGFLAGIGWNDAAAPGGGLYHEASKVNRNDKALKVDVSDKYRIESAQEFLDVLLNPDCWEDQVKKWEDDPSFSDDIRREQHTWLTEFAKNIKSLNSNNGIARVLPRLDAFRNTRIYNLIEFGRSVHAEMAAITQAAMAGISTKGSTLYVTTFPCHECVRNIIAAGVDRVLYIEPYGKSMAPLLYVDELMESSRSTTDDYVAFDSYVGISVNQDRKSVV